MRFREWDRPLARESRGQEAAQNREKSLIALFDNALHEELR